MKYNIYIDESGNTGNIRIDEANQWNFNVQKYFSLGAIIVKADYADNLENEFREILLRYMPGLGDNTELKAKKDYKFTTELLFDISNLLEKYSACTMFDISNKKYKVIMQIVEYYVYPYYSFGWDISAMREKRIIAATNIYNSLPDVEIKKYMDICENSLYTNGEIIEKLLLFLDNLKGYIDKSLYGNIDETKEKIQNYKQYNLEIENLLPIKDYTNRGKKLSFLPNTDAFTNLILQIASFQAPKSSNLDIYHDEQKQFSNVIQDWANNLKARGVNIDNIKFISSTNNSLIQMTDFLTGNILKLYEDIVDNAYANKRNRDKIKILKTLLKSCNIVSTRAEQAIFFDTCGINYVRTPMPNIKI